MRIIAGKYKGRLIKGKVLAQTRPTTDRVKEALFNILTHTFLKEEGTPFLLNATILDCFAGSGALALEALSRGAAFATCVEKDGEVFKILKENFKFLSEAQAVLLNQDVFTLPQALNPATLIFMDPPYEANFYEKTLEILLKKGWINKETLIMLESKKSTKLAIINPFCLVLERVYGNTKLVFLKLKDS